MPLPCWWDPMPRWCWREVSIMRARDGELMGAGSQGCISMSQIWTEVLSSTRAGSGSSCGCSVPSTLGSWLTTSL